MRSTRESTVRDLILDRTVDVEMFHSDTDWPSIVVEGKVDTGADRCSIDGSLAKHLGWEAIGHKTVKSSLGRESRDLVRGVVEIRGIKFTLTATVSNREGLSHSLLVGHNIISDLVLSEEE